MLKIRILAALCALLIASLSAEAQSNISVAFTGFGFDFGKGENVAIYNHKISDGKNPIFEPGLRIGEEVYASPATSIKVVQTLRCDVMDRMSMSTQLMLRFRVFKVYKHSVSLGVGPTAFYRKSWSNIGGYVDDGTYEDGTYQHKKKQQMRHVSVVQIIRFDLYGRGAPRPYDNQPTLREIQMPSSANAIDDTTTTGMAYILSSM